MTNIESFAKSMCCNAKVKVIGRTTKHYVCTSCNNPCNVRVFNIEKGSIKKR